MNGTALQAGSAVGATAAMPMVFWTGSFASCGRGILELLDGTDAPADFLVVFDGPTPSTPMWLAGLDVRMTSTGRRSDPAHARNLAVARRRIILFGDADVELEPGSIERVATAFEEDPAPVGMLGAYDDEPVAGGAVSCFRNMFCDDTRVVHAGRAVMLWSGCGALRAAELLDDGGFDETSLRPSIEDIEPGMQITAQLGRIVLDPTLWFKHLKQWTFSCMLNADFSDRAKPWTQLMVETRQLPATLNIDWKGRASGVTSLSMAAGLICVPLEPRAVWVALAAAALHACMNLRFYRLCLRTGAARFAASSIALHAFFSSLQRPRSGPLFSAGC